jgi:hypothetical protein
VPVSAAEVRLRHRAALFQSSWSATQSKWFKPAKGQFQIYYKLGTEQPEYIPDFVAETDSTIFMVETKARTPTSIRKRFRPKPAAARWCKHASAHAVEVGTKPWKYLLVPHDEVSESKRLSDYLRFEVLSGDSLVIEDDGTGMTEEELRSHYLAIATDRRSRRGERTAGKNRVGQG